MYAKHELFNVVSQYNIQAIYIYLHALTAHKSMSKLHTIGPVLKLSLTQKLTMNFCEKEY